MNEHYLLAYLSKRFPSASAPATQKTETIQCAEEEGETAKRETEREGIRFGMRRKGERTREMETMRRPSLHDGGESSHFTRLTFRVEHRKGLMLLTCAEVTSDAISTQHNTNQKKELSLQRLFSFTKQLLYYCKYTLCSFTIIANMPFINLLLLQIYPLLIFCTTLENFSSLFIINFFTIISLYINFYFIQLLY